MDTLTNRSRARTATDPFSGSQLSQSFPSSTEPLRWRRPRRCLRSTGLLLLLGCAAVCWPFFPSFPASGKWKSKGMVHFHVTSTQPTLQHHQEKGYLAYLPHSGFHNQRIALENALILASLLNRTLLVPPIQLSSRPLQYMEFDRLRHYFLILQKQHLIHCSQLPADTELPVECLDYATHTSLSWSTLTNLSSLSDNFSFIETKNFEPGALRASFGITVEQTYFFKDKQVYQYRFYEDPTDNQPHVRFSSRVDIPQLAQDSASFKLLQMGTLFGTRRLRLRLSKSVLKRVRAALVFENPLLNQVSNSIHDELSSRRFHPRNRWRPKENVSQGYVAVHLRLGDGGFAQNAATNVNQTWTALITGPKIGLTEAQAVPSLLAAKLANQTCVGPVPSEPLAAALTFPVFVATDNPGHRALEIFHRSLPCLFSLDSPNIVPYLAPLKAVTNHDGVPLFKYLVSFVDAMVAARGLEVYGTPNSTFSRFVEDVLWRRYHGLENISRG